TLLSVNPISGSPARCEAESDTAAVEDSSPGDTSSRLMMGEYDRPGPNPHQSRSVVTGKYGMVATSQPLAAQTGLDILKAGGNAIDAAIAANAMIGLVEPGANGIGGDLFVIYW